MPAAADPGAPPAEAVDQIAGLVGRVGMQADLVRALATRAAAAAEALLWRSAGATVFRDRVLADAAALRAAADLLDSAGDLLRRYALDVSGGP